MCFCGSRDPHKTHGGGKRGLCVFCGLHEPQKHMLEANVVCVIHKLHMVGPFVVYVFFVVSHKPQMPPPCVLGGFTYTTFASTT